MASTTLHGSNRNNNNNSTGNSTSLNPRCAACPALPRPAASKPSP